MPRCHAALAISDFLSSDNDAPPPTKRFGARDLATALAAMDLADPRDDDPTLTVAGAEHRRFVANAFRTHCAATRPLTDDDPTLEAPAPVLPPGIPSPLGDEEDGDGRRESDPHAHLTGPLVAAIEIPRWMPEETLTLHDLGVDLDDDLPFLPDGPGFAPAPVSTERPIAGRLQKQKAAERNTRLFVIGLWTVAIGMTSILAYLMATATTMTP
jgi:hypothetical protein